MGLNIICVRRAIIYTADDAKKHTRSGSSKLLAHRPEDPGVSTYSYYFSVSPLCYQGIVGLVGHSGAEDTWCAYVDITQSNLA